jgi:menaquinone-9 beta-reductase
MATLPKVLISRADYQIGGGVALRLRTQGATPAADGKAGVLPQFARQESDVIVVGAGLAGCSAARLFALEGLSVALVESHRDVRTFKQLCTHFVQPSAYPVLRRIGLDQLIERAGGVRNGIDLWSRYGWTGDVPPFTAEGQPAFGYNIQRRTLDPMLRQLAGLVLRCGR